MPVEFPKIACLGWGSLIWDPRTLPIRKPWFNDGPLLPVEFARKSSDERVTLVIVPEESARTAYVRTLWALMVVHSLDEAIERLAERETPKNHGGDKIGRWPCDSTKSKNFAFADVIEEWAGEKGLGGVVWTALPPTFGGQDEVIEHLRALSSDGDKWKHAEEYVRKAPVQIDTEYRRRIECEFGWTPLPARL
jgi:hypothetical protein